MSGGLSLYATLAAVLGHAVHVTATAAFAQGTTDPCANYHPAPPPPPAHCKSLQPAPAGFTATGLGWFSGTCQNCDASCPWPPQKSQDNGCTGQGITVSACATACAADSDCHAFHLYMSSQSCIVGDCWLHSAPLGAFVNHSDSFAYIKSGTHDSHVDLEAPPVCLGSHTLKLDEAGKLETWLPTKTAHHDLVMQAMEFLDHVPVEPQNGLPVYYTGPRLPISNYPHNPASLFSQWVDLALRLYAYTGNNSWVLKTEAMLSHHLKNGITPNSTDWAWPGVPYASSDPGDVLYRGSGFGNISGSGDGVGVIETDKIGGIGLGWLAIWKHYGSGSQRRDFFEAAVHCARVLALNVKKHGDSNATASPWPFRTYAQTGAVRNAGGHIGEMYSAHVIWNIQLLDAILAIPGALSSVDAMAAKLARSTAWEWMVHYPLENNQWCGYCEDVTTAGLDWEDGKCDYDSITFRMTARYLMGVPVAGGSVQPNGGAGTGTPVLWQTAVPKMLSWVESALIFWANPGPHSPPVQYGARCVSEQRDDPNRMSCHTSSYASVLAQYAEALTKHQTNSTAAADAAENARLSWAWASYSLDSTGNIHVTPGQGETDTWWTVTIDTLMNTMVS